MIGRADGGIMTKRTLGWSDGQAANRMVWRAVGRYDGRTVGRSSGRSNSDGKKLHMYILLLGYSFTGGKHVNDTMESDCSRGYGTT